MDVKQPRILIAEDEEINRMILREILKEKYEVIEAENGHQAIYQIKEYGQDISLIILDIHMPSLDGYGVMDYLVENGLNEKIPVIITTIDQSTKVLLTGKKNKVADIVYKPFRATDIKKRVDNLVEICRYEQNLNEIIEDKAAYLTKEYNAMNNMKNFGKMKYAEALHTMVDEIMPENKAHIERIKAYTEIVCRAIMTRYPKYGLGKTETKVIADTCVLHDLGKLVISDDIFGAGDVSNNRAFMQIRKRPIAASEMIEMMFIDSEHKLEKKHAYEICRYMHEQYDGKGYPEGLRGSEIPLCAQIVGFVHRYDALRFPTDKLMTIDHKNACKQLLSAEFKSYNPDILEIFEDNSDMFEMIAEEKK